MVSGKARAKQHYTGDTAARKDEARRVAGLLGGRTAWDQPPIGAHSDDAPLLL